MDDAWLGASAGARGGNARGRWRARRAQAATPHGAISTSRASPRISPRCGASAPYEEAAIRGLKDGLVLGAIPPLDRAGGGRHGRVASISDPAPILLLSTHPRPRPTPWRRARTAGAMMRELFGREGGTCGGKGGSMHIADFGVGACSARTAWWARTSPIAGGRGARRQAAAAGPRSSPALSPPPSGTAPSTAGRSSRGLNWAKVLRSARPVRLRGQYVVRHHPYRGSHRRRGRGGPRAKPRYSRADARRQRRDRPRRGGAGGDRDGCAPAAGRGSCT